MGGFHGMCRHLHFSSHPLKVVATTLSWRMQQFSQHRFAMEALSTALNCTEVLMYEKVLMDGKDVRLGAGGVGHGWLSAASLFRRCKCVSMKFISGNVWLKLFNRWRKTNKKFRLRQKVNSVSLNRVFHTVADDGYGCGCGCGSSSSFGSLQKLLWIL